MADGGFQCCTLHPALHPGRPGFPIFRPCLPRPLLPPPPPAPLLVAARLAILDALRRPRERDSCGEIELNLEMNIESNELSTYLSTSQPASYYLRATPSALRASPTCRLSALRPLVPPLFPRAFLHVLAPSTRFARNLFIYTLRTRDCFSSRWRDDRRRICPTSGRGE